MNSHRPIVYIVDDDTSVCRALSLLVKAHGYSPQAFTRAADFLVFKHPALPSCLLLDVQLPDINGLALQETMALRQYTIPIIFITGHGDIPMSVKSMQAGAIDFLPKPVTAKKLFAAVDRAITRSKAQLHEHAEMALIQKHINSLSPREMEVFQLVAQGLLSKQIARKRGTSLQTIKVHRGRVMQKMHASTVTELIRFAQKAGVTPSKP
jgi:FixJ family two-component response regulator